MSDDNETTLHDEQGFQPDPEPRRGWRDRFRGRFSGLGARDRVIGMRGAVAVGLAGLVIGGAGGWTLHAVTGPDHRGGDHTRFGRPFTDQDGQDGNGFPGPAGDQGHPGPPMGGTPGQLPPATGPDEEQQGYSSGGSNS